jgi:hypothetical protein
MFLSKKRRRTPIYFMVVKRRDDLIKGNEAQSIFKHKSASFEQISENKVHFFIRQHKQEISKQGTKIKRETSEYYKFVFVLNY